MASGNPFVGPNPLTRNQPLFGRDKELRELSYLLTSDRIVLLHSPSGAGKSSLLNAKGGLVERMSPKFDVCGPLRVNEQPARSAGNRFLWSVAHGMAPPVAEAGGSPSLLDCAKERDQEQDNLLLIFDQFEEALTVDPARTDWKREFFEAIGELLSERWIWALFVIREDYLAQLDPYARRVPTHLNNRYRLDLLQKNRAQEAIEKTAASAAPKRTFHPAAIEALRESLSAVNVTQPDGSTGVEPGEYIEPLQLQLVCFDLWEHLPEPQLEISAQAVKDLGDVAQALRNFYDRTVDAVGRRGPEQFQIRNWIHEKLITHGRRNQVQFLETAGASEGLDNRFIREMLRLLLLRREPRGNGSIVELAHDRLLDPVIKSNADWFETRLSIYEKRARLWEKERASGLVYVDEELKAAREWRAQTRTPLFDIDPFLEACDERQKILDKERDLTRRAREWLQRAAVLALGAIVASGTAIYFSYRAKQQEGAAILSGAAALETDVAARIRNARTREQLSAAMAATANERKKAAELYQTAQKQTARADEASSVAAARQLLAISAGLPESDPDRALWAVASSRERISAEATRALADVTALLPKFVTDFVTGDFLADESPPMAFSPDGKTVAGVHTQGDLFWGSPDGSNLKTNRYRHPRNIQALAVSSNQRIVFTDGQGVFVYDIAASRITHQIPGSGIVTISPDGKWIASAAAKLGTLQIAYIEKNPPAARKFDGGGAVQSVSFTRDSGGLIWSHAPYPWCRVSLDPAQLETVKPACTATPGRDMRALSAWDSNLFAWASAEGKTGWTADGGSTVAERPQPGYEILSIRWPTPNGWVALSRDSRTGAARVYDYRQATYLASIPGNAVTLDPALPRAVSREGRFLKVYDYSPRYPAVRLENLVSDTPRLSADGRRIAILDGSRAAVLDASTGKPLREASLHVKSAAVHLSPNGRFLLAVTASREDGMRIPNHVPQAEVFDLESGATRIVRIHTQEEFSDSPWGVANDGKSAINLGSAAVWVDLETGRTRAAPQLHSSFGRQLAIDPSSKRFGYRGATFEGQPLLVLAPLPLSEDGHGRAAPLLGMESELVSMAFRADGKLAAVADERGNVSIYDTASLSEISRKRFAPPVSSLAFDRSGDLLVLHRPNGVWQLQRTLKDDPRVLMQEICSRLQFTLSEADWKKQAPNLAYRNPCPALPLPRDPTLF